LTEAFAKLNQTPLALFPSDENHPDNGDFFYIYIDMSGIHFKFYPFTIYCLKLKNRLANVSPRRLIKLLVHPSTVDELALIRFWLLKLSQTHFEQFYANRAILNPEFLSVLNPRTGPRKIMFHANEVINDSGVAIHADFAQFICARRIILHAPVLESHRRNLFKFIIGTGNTLEEVNIYSSGQNKGEICEFLVKVKFGNSFL
jgi:hypothetical protein